MLREFRGTLIAYLVAACLAAFTGSARADFDASKNWFEALSSDTRLVIQTGLVLTSHYDRLIDADFGVGTFKAVESFERSLGHIPDGVLDSGEAQSLDAQASRIIETLGLETAQDPQTGLSFLLAKKIFVGSSEKAGRTIYSSSEGGITIATWAKDQGQELFEATFGKAVTASLHRQVVYSKLSTDAFTVSGKIDSGFFFYTRGIRGNGRTVGFDLLYDQNHRSVGTMLAILLASMSALPSELQSQPSAPGGSEVASGSGFFISGDGAILTNYHVAGACSKIDVPPYGPATLLKGDANVDLAVIQLTTPVKTPWAEIRRDPVQLGESVVLVGFPLADILNSALNVSTGVVSSLTGLADKPMWFTTNAGIQPGNSGGPILDANAVVIGVVVAKIDEAKMLANEGTVAPNLGFGINAKDVLGFLKIFDHSEVPASSAAPLSAQEIAAKAKTFTVQVICTAGENTN